MQLSVLVLLRISPCAGCKYGCNNSPTCEQQHYDWRFQINFQRDCLNRWEQRNAYRIKSGMRVRQGPRGRGPNELPADPPSYSGSVSQFAGKIFRATRDPAHPRNDVHHINILIAFSTYFMSQYTHRTENSRGRPTAWSAVLPTFTDKNSHAY